MRKIIMLTMSLFFVQINQAQIKLIHPAGKFVTVNGVKLWTEESGRGNPLFLIMGGPGDAHILMHTYDKLQDSFLLVFIDNFGTGKSDTAKDATQYSIDRDVENVEGVRKALGFDKIDLLGHSYGSVVVEKYALKYGSHLQHLIIVGGLYNTEMWQEACSSPNHEIAENEPELWDSLMMLRAQGYKSSDEIHVNLYNKFIHGLIFSYCPNNSKNLPVDDNYPNQSNNKVYYQIVGPDGDFILGNDAAKFDVTNELKNLKMPILIIAGRFDRISVPKYAVLYKKYCPQAKFVMFEHSGHGPQVEEPEKTFSLITNFLQGR
jgi:proline iminopeptidase